MILPANAEGIIDVDVVHCIIPLVSVVFTSWAQSIIQEGAVSSHPSIISRCRQDAEPVGHLNDSVLIIVLIISNSVTNHEALKIGDVRAALVLGAVSNVPVDSLDKTRDIDSSIRLSSNVKIFGLKLGELIHNC